MQRPRRSKAKKPVQASSDTDTDEDTSNLIHQAVQLQQQQHGNIIVAPPPPSATGGSSSLPLPGSPQPPSEAPQPPKLATGAAKAAGKGKGRGSKTGSRRPAGAMTVKTLVEAGILIPGTSVLTVDYKGSCTYADLSHEGQILCKGLAFDSPSAFSIYIKRLVNPTRKADDGWKSVKYNGRLLETYKDDYLRMQLQQQQPATTQAAQAAAAQAEEVIAAAERHLSTTRATRTSRQPANTSNGAPGGLPAAKRHRISDAPVLPPLVGTTSLQQVGLSHTGQANMASGCGPPQPPPAPPAQPANEEEEEQEEEGEEQPEEQPGEVDGEEEGEGEEDEEGVGQQQQDKGGALWPPPQAADLLAAAAAGSMG